MRLKRTLAFCLGAALGAGLLAGCAPKVDQSGWEIARKKSPTERLESFIDAAFGVMRRPAGCVLE